MTERNALVLAAVTSMTWGLTGVFVRLLPPLSPVTIAAGRLVIALVAVLPLLLLLREQRRAFATALGYPVSYWLALLLAGYYLLATAAFQMAPVAEVALLLSTPPLFILTIRGFRGDPASRAEIGGALLAMCGMALILVPKISVGSGQSTQHLLGDLIALCAAGLTAVYAYTYQIVALRGTAPETSGVSVLTFAMGSVIFCVMALLVPSPAGLENLDLKAKGIFLLLGIVSTAVPTIGFAVVAKRLPAIITSMISLFIPLFSAVFAYLLLGERLSLMFLVGCALVLLGVAMIVRKNQGGQNKPPAQESTTK